MPYKPRQKVCAYCKKDFIATNAKNVFCGKACFGLSYSEKKAQNRSMVLDEIIPLYLSGDGISAIAKKFHIESKFVKQHLVDSGIKLRTLGECNRINMNRRSKPMMRQCKHCGSDFRTYPSYDRRNRGKFCSKKCAYSYPPNRLKQSKVALRLLSQKRFGKETKLEKTMQALLESVDAEFVKQYRIKNFVYDFYWPEFNILIEMDGDYWHGNIPKEKWRPFHYKNSERDKAKTELANKLGYELIRIPEGYFYKNIHLLENICLEKSEQQAIKA